MRKLRFLPLILIIPIIFCIKIYREFDVEKMRDEIEKRYSQVVLDDRDNIIGAYLNSEEQWQIKGVEIPPRLKLAVLNYEDRKFYSHNGVDYLAIVRAVKTNLLEKRRVGASTITMQGVKLYKRRERTYLSKIEEIIESYKLEKYLSKDEILELYLNNAPYGSNIVGYETASQLYFGKSAKNLTWAEGATLAVLPNSPGLIWIEKNRDKLLNKRDNLLKNMYERGVIDEKQYRLSIKEELPKERKYFNSLAPHLTRRTKFQIGEAILELTQIGKECHSHCAIYKVMGDCIMPREGVFTRVLKGGEIKAGDEITMLPLEKDRPFTAAIITLSDKGAAGEREDKSGPLIQEMLMKEGYDVIETLLLPDGEQPLKHQLMRLADQRQVNVIFTTGGTGFAERDVTPEATQAVCDRMAMGIADAIRQYSLSITGRAMLSRAVSGIRKKTLIVNLPGSPKAVKESLEYVLPHLGHGLGILRGTDGECGNS